MSCFIQVFMTNYYTIIINKKDSPDTFTLVVYLSIGNYLHLHVVINPRSGAACAPLELSQSLHEQFSRTTLSCMEVLN